MGRALMIPGMVGKNISSWIKENNLPPNVASFGKTEKEIFVCYEELMDKYGKDMKDIPLGAIGIYSFAQKLRVGLQQLMAGSGEMVLMGGRDRLMTSSVFMLAEPNMKEIPSETSIQQQIIDLQQSITFLEEIWMTDDLIRQEISEEDWQAFMNALYESFEGLQPAAEQ
jgi:hypothetical protein